MDFICLWIRASRGNCLYLVYPYKKQSKVIELPPGKRRKERSEALSHFPRCLAKYPGSCNFGNRHHVKSRCGRYGHNSLKENDSVWTILLSNKGFKKPLPCIPKKVRFKLLTIGGFLIGSGFFIAKIIQILCSNTFIFQKVSLKCLFLMRHRHFRPNDVPCPFRRRTFLCLIRFPVL